MGSQSRVASARGFPIRIQVLDPSNELKYPYRQPKTRWEFTLSLLPETKMFEVCLHAAQYMSRNFHTIVNGRELAAQSRDGTILEDRESLSEDVLRGETLFLIERRLLDMDQSARRDFPRSSLDPLHPNWTSQAANHERSKSLFSAESHSQADDESDQVPPPRKLPFASATTASSPRPPSSTALTRPPLGERPDLVNTSARTPFGEQTVDSTPENDREGANSKKQPDAGQSRPQSVLERSASAARNRKVGSVPERNQQSETPAMTRRPRISQGPQRNGNTAPNQGPVSSIISSATKSNPSGSVVHNQEPATSACMRCRKKKRKCDKSKPTCGPCQKDERPCIYPRSQGTAAVRSGADKASPENDLAVTNHSLASKSQASIPATTMGNVPQQNSQAKKTREMGVQTQETEHGKRDVEIKHAGTDPCRPYVDASTETEKCDDIWLPFSQCAKVVYWAGRRYEEKIQKAADILREADPSQEDYRDKVQQAAMHGFVFQQELQQKCEEALREL
ncbi:hypothetical protein N8I77_011373 [Diaporthe amygdali]|uniref:Zn(2)-C6 fungal-type domain-containing protein n=1 Tax=Phomopsis amygdali TaxID=1214568 RepID=A0AAD9S5C5_PHOAM|nr:hypothetical protein N8I77_011373 [Diaporthe amygdali]